MAYSDMATELVLSKIDQIAAYGRCLGDTVLSQEAKFALNASCRQLRWCDTGKIVKKLDAGKPGTPPESAVLVRAMQRLYEDCERLLFSESYCGLVRYCVKSGQPESAVGKALRHIERKDAPRAMKEIRKLQKPLQASRGTVRTDEERELFVLLNTAGNVLEPLVPD